MEKYTSWHMDLLCCVCLTQLNFSAIYRLYLNPLLTATSRVWASASRLIINLKPWALQNDNWAFGLKVCSIPEASKQRKQKMDTKHVPLYNCGVITQTNNRLLMQLHHQTRTFPIWVIRLINPTVRKGQKNCWLLPDNEPRLVCSVPL